MGIKIQELVQHLLRTTISGGREDQGHDGEALWECLEVVVDHEGQRETQLQDLAASTEEIIAVIEEARDGCASLSPSDVTTINEGLPILRRRLNAYRQATVTTEPATTHA